MDNEQHPSSPFFSSQQSRFEEQQSQGAPESGTQDVQMEATLHDNNNLSDNNSLPALQPISDTSLDIDLADMHAFSDDNTPVESIPSHPGMAPATADVTTGTSSRRRARVENDEDEERDRRHPSQRVGTRIDEQTAAPASVSSSPTSLPPQPSSPGTQPQLRPLHIHPHPPRVIATINVPTFIRFSGPDALRFAQQQQQQQPQPAQPNPGPMLGGFTMSLDLRGGPAGQANPGVHVHTHPPQFFAAPPEANQGANAGPGQPMGGNVMQQLFNIMQGMGGQFAFGFDRHEPEDPERAKKLVDALEEVPPGLVRRLERVGGNVGGSEGAETGATGGDVGCAICWDRLLDGDGGKGWGVSKDENQGGEHESVGDEGAPTASSSSDECLMKERANPAEMTYPKIVVLPCAHVFHATCLIPWFSRPRQTTCPTCRFNIDPDNLTYLRPRQPQPASAGTANPIPNSVEQNTDATQGADQQAPQMPSGWEVPSTVLNDPAPTNTQPAAANPANQVPTEQSGLPDFVDGILMFANPAPVEGDLGTRIDQARRGVETLEDLRNSLAQRLAEVDAQVEAGFPAPNEQPQQQPQEGQGDENNMRTAPASNDGDEDDDPPLLPLDGGDVAMADANASPGTAAGNTSGLHNNSTNANPTSGQNTENPLQTFLTVGFDVLVGIGPVLAGGNFDGADIFRFNQAAPPPPQQQPQPVALHEPPPLQPTANVNAPTVDGSSTADPNAPPNPNTNMFLEFARTMQRVTGFIQETNDSVRQAMQIVTGPPAAVEQVPVEGQTQGQEQQQGFGNLPGMLASIFGSMMGPGTAQPTPGDTNPDAAAPPGGDTNIASDPATNPGNPAHPEQATNPQPQRDTLRDFMESIVEAAIRHGFAQTGPGGPGAIPGGAPRAVPIPGFAFGGAMPSRPPHPVRTWTLPPAPGPTLRQRVERKEREAGLRCHDFSCGVGPSDEDPFVGLSEVSKKQVGIVVRHLGVAADEDAGEVEVEASVCPHTFHAPCLVSAARLGMLGMGLEVEVSATDGYVEVACSVCKGVGRVRKADWDEGVTALG